MDAGEDGRPFIKVLKIDVTSNDQSLNLETVEDYTLNVNGPKSTLQVHRHTQSILCLQYHGSAELIHVNPATFR